MIQARTAVNEIIGIQNQPAFYDAGFGPFVRQPSGVTPTLSLTFAGATSLDPRITFARASNATLFDSTGKLTYAPANMFTYSNGFSNADWAKIRVSVSTGFTGPDSQPAFNLVGASGVNRGLIRQSVSFQRGIIQVKCKANGYNYVAVGLTNVGGLYGSYVFNLSNGTVGAFEDVGSAAIGYGATITALGGGWYLCSVVIGDPTAGVVTTFIGPSVTSAYVFGSNYNGVDGVLACDAMAGPVTYQTTPSTYIATTSAAYYGPRFDYDPSTLAAKGLLIEEARTNLALQSQAFDSAVWLKKNITLTNNAITAPDGTTSAEKAAITNATAATALEPASSITVTIGNVVTCSCYIKASGVQYANLGFAYSGGIFAGAQFDLTAVSVLRAAATGGYTSPSATITAVSGGWFRCTFTVTTSTALMFPVVVPSNALWTSGEVEQTLTGNGTDGVYVWGMQAEVGAFATSYIPTAASAVARVADTATMTGANFSSWYSQTAGTFVVVGDTANADAPGTQERTPITVTDSGSNYMLYPRIDLTLFKVAMGLSEIASATRSTSIIFAAAYATSDRAVSISGAAVQSSAAAYTAIVATRMGIGQYIPSPSRYLGGHIASITYYPARLPNATLQSLTS